ncbi:MAG: hypothetical protein NDI60_04100 [Elusimicrobiales bacterium]|nr:hypothetical protein [Elusimicrobiales bacterium]
MKKILLTFVLSVLAAGAAAAENLDFTDNSFAAQLTAPAAAAEVETPEAPARARTGRYVQVSGYVSLNGNGWMPGTDGGFTSVNLNGWATFRDGSGQITSNNVSINTSVSLWVRPNQYVMQSVWPNVYATFYRNGKMVGSTSMSGSISVSGWPSGSFFSLSGSGYLSGSIYVEDEE